MKAANRLNYEKQIRNLNNKMKTTWEIIFRNREKGINDDIYNLSLLTV